MVDKCLKSALIVSFWTMFMPCNFGQELYFPPVFSEDWEEIGLAELNWCEDNVEDFNSFLEESNSKACIILKDGKMAHEAYFDDFDLSSSWYWASAGKSLTAAMVGIMQDEDLLEIHAPTSDYLGEGWTQCAADEAEITLWHQMTMTSGLDYTVDDIYCTEPECLQCLNLPGEEWFYHNAPYTLLSDVMEAASEQGYTAITNSKLTNKIGFIGLWTKVNTGRLFWSTARGMARFGLLMLNNGDWAEEVVIKDKTFVQDMLSTSQDINKAYGYLWWLNGKESYRLPGTTITFPGSLIPNAPDDLYAAIGKNGQVLMVVPSQNVVIARMGENPDNSLVPTSFVRDLWDEFQKLSCTVANEDVEPLTFDVRPRLAWNRIVLKTDADIDSYVVFDSSGNRMLTGAAKIIDVSSLQNGLYFVQLAKGSHVATRRFLKM